jgi:hypothetical protein
MVECIYFSFEIILTFFLTF